jgi:Spy/CpxP family protein refolding chaperone
MSRPGAILSVVAIFTIGVTVGGLGMHLHEAAGMVFAGHSGPDHQSHIDVLSRELNLTDDQRKQVETILGEARSESRLLHEKLAPMVHEHIRDTLERLSAVLTPEQNRMLDALVEKHRSHLERMVLTPGGI